MFGEDLPLVGLARWEIWGRGLAAVSGPQPWVNLRASQVTGKEDGLESDVRVFPQTVCAPGSREEKALWVLLQP